jgi:FHS family Na+ dependent glucose MFS transporter 1
MSSPLSSTSREIETTPRLYQLSSTYAYYAAFIALGLAAAVLGPTIGDLARQTGVRMDLISYLFTARSLGYLLGTSQGGRVYDYLPGHLVMAIMLTAMAFSLALSPLLPMLWLLIAVMFLLGIGEGAVDVGGNTILVWLHGTRVGPFMNSLHFFFGLGAFLPALIIDRVKAGSGGITWAYWILAIAILPVIVWLLRLPSPSAPHKEKTAGPVRKDSLLVALVAVFFFFYVGAEIAFAGWIYSYATALGVKSTLAAFLTSGFWGALTVGRFLSIPLVIDLAGCLISVSLLLFFPASTLALWAGTIGVGLSMASVFPTTLLLAGSHMTITGTVNGWFFMGSSLGGAALPWLIGQLFEAISPRMTMIVIMIDLIIMLVFFAGLVLHSTRTRAHSNM